MPIKGREDTNGGMAAAGHARDRAPFMLYTDGPRGRGAGGLGSNETAAKEVEPGSVLIGRRDRARGALRHARRHRVSDPARRAALGPQGREPARRRARHPGHEPGEPGRPGLRRAGGHRLRRGVLRAQQRRRARDPARAPRRRPRIRSSQDREDLRAGLDEIVAEPTHHGRAREIGWSLRSRKVPLGRSDHPHPGDERTPVSQPRRCCFVRRTDADTRRGQRRGQRDLAAPARVMPQNETARARIVEGSEHHGIAGARVGELLAEYAHSATWRRPRKWRPTPQPGGPHDATHLPGGLHRGAHRERHTARSISKYRPRVPIRASRV